MTLILVMVGPAVFLFALELMVLWLTKNGGKVLRFLPLLGLAIPAGLAIQCAIEGGWFWQIGVILYGIMVALMFLGWALAWLGRPKGGTEDKDV